MRDECAAEVVVVVRVYICLGAGMAAHALRDIFPIGWDIASSHARAPYIAAETGLAEEAADRVGAIFGSNDGEVILPGIVLLVENVHVIREELPVGGLAVRIFVVAMVSVNGLLGMARLDGLVMDLQTPRPVVTFIWQRQGVDIDDLESDSALFVVGSWRKTERAISAVE